jgi:hypothetical protein
MHSVCACVLCLSYRPHRCCAPRQWMRSRACQVSLNACGICICLSSWQHRLLVRSSRGSQLRQTQIPHALRGLPSKRVPCCLSHTCRIHFLSGAQRVCLLLLLARCMFVHLYSCMCVCTVGCEVRNSPGGVCGW